MLLPAWELTLAWFAWTDISLGENLAKPTLSFDPAMTEVTFEKGPSSVAVSSVLILPLTSLFPSTAGTFLPYWVRSLWYKDPALQGQHPMSQGPIQVLLDGLEGYFFSHTWGIPHKTKKPSG